MKITKDMKESSINAWHKDGKGMGVEVYKNGTLAKTKGKWEMITLVIKD